MTYREKFIQELFDGTSERKEEMLDVILELVCPPNFGYEDEFNCNQDGCLYEGKCKRCWDREIE